MTYAIGSLIMLSCGFFVLNIFQYRFNYMGVSIRHLSTIGVSISGLLLIVLMYYYGGLDGGCKLESNTLFKTGALLLFIIFSSTFLVLISGGFKTSSVKALVCVKTVPDLFLILYLSIGGFLGITYDVEFINLSTVLGFENTSFILGFLIFYIMISFFGFWIFWGMEGKSLVSCFIHTCGLVFVGVFLFSIMVSGDLVPIKVYYICSTLSVFTLFVYIILFVIVRPLKRAIGFFSASSICWVFLTIIVLGPKLGLGVFVISSCLKIGMFIILEESKREFSVRSILLGFIILIILVVSIHLLLKPTVMKYNTSSEGIDGVKYFTVLAFQLIPTLEAVGVSLFFIKLLKSCKRHKRVYMNSFKFNIFFIFLGYLGTLLLILEGSVDMFGLSFLDFLGLRVTFGLWTIGIIPNTRYIQDVESLLRKGVNSLLERLEKQYFNFKSMKCNKLFMEDLSNFNNFRDRIFQGMVFSMYVLLFIIFTYGIYSSSIFGGANTFKYMDTLGIVLIKLI